MTETLEHRTGHKFVPNGVGDYELICPTLGKVPGFVPFMLARIASGNRVCNACGQKIGERVDQPPDPKDWELTLHREGHYSARRNGDGMEIADLTPFGNRVPDHLL